MGRWRRGGAPPAVEEQAEFSILGFEGAPHDTAVFPWRGDGAASALDEPVATTAVVATRPWATEVGLLLARVVLGVTAILGGARTLFDLPRGHADGTAATRALLGGYGFAPAGGLTTALGWAEIVAGLLVVLGVLASFAASALVAVHLVAMCLTLPAAWAAGAVGPAEAPVFGLALSALVVLSGPGRISGDADRAWYRAQTPVGVSCMIIGVGTGLTVLLFMRG
ncbi:DoxX family protein [Actinomycetospora sp.]|uniref:DoxX family protein n=1 Tax=Actinomycetospora sp. TaxID=1872135 RepID=UPI002F3E6E49